MAIISALTERMPPARLDCLETVFMKVNMREAKSQLSRLGELAWEGEEIIITEASEPYLRLVLYRAPLKERKPGRLEGQIWIAPDFDETPQDVIDSFYNSKIFPDEDE